MPLKNTHTVKLGIHGSGGGDSGDGGGGSENDIDVCPLTFLICGECCQYRLIW
jgi:hypothetical protein